MGLAGCQADSRGSVDRTESVEAVELLRLGSLDGGPDAFGSISGFDWGPAGRIRVADAFGNQISEFDAAGTYIRSFGRKGEGPGEFLEIMGLVSLGSRFLVAERWPPQFSLFDSTGAFIRRIARGAQGVAVPWNGSAIDSATILDFFPRFDGSRLEFVPLELNVDTEQHDTLPSISFTPPYPLFDVPGLLIPYLSMLKWSPDSSSDLWYGVNDVPLIMHRAARGGIVDTVLTLGSSPEPVSQASRERLADSLDALSADFKRSWLPARLPAFSAIWPLGDGLVAIVHSRQPFVETGTTVDVYEEDTMVGTEHFDLAIHSRPIRVRGERVLAVGEDAVGIQYVVVLEFRRR